MPLAASACGLVLSLLVRLAGHAARPGPHGRAARSTRRPGADPSTGAVRARPQPGYGPALQRGQSGARRPGVGAVDTVESEVRELVRRRGLDPITDRAAVRRLVDEVVNDYDDRALSSSLPPLPDSTVAARAVYDAVAGFGPLQRHLDDPSIEEIWINERLTAGCDTRQVSADGRCSPVARRRVGRTTGRLYD